MESEPIIEKVVAYLYDLGHRRIAFIRGPVTKQTELDRYKGYIAGLTNLGLEVDNSLIGAGNWHELTGKAATEKFLALASPPTAIIASNDVMAFEAMCAIQEKGMKIPQDISVVGYDDIALASMTDLPIDHRPHPHDPDGHCRRRVYGFPAGRRIAKSTPSLFPAGNRHPDI